MNFKASLALLVVAAAPWTALAAATGGAEAALAWLSATDTGAYSRSWTTSGALFRAHISDAEWSRKIKPTREPLGAVLSRKLMSEKATETLPGAPDGHYDVLQFQTEFAAKHDAVETVILAAEPSGWKVDGYFIK